VVGKNTERGIAMKNLVCIAGVLVLIIGTTSGIASTTCAYDNLKRALLTGKLVGRACMPTRVLTLEVSRAIKNQTTLNSKALNIANRSYAYEGSNSGRRTAATRLFFPYGGSITTIQATVLVKKNQATGCSTVNTFATEGQLRIGGAFFNASTDVPAAGDQTNDVFAYITVSRAIDSPNAGNVLDVEGKTQICTNADCSNSNEISTVVLGTLKVNTKAKLTITWDQAGNSFVFKKGNTEVSLPYTQSDSWAPETDNGGNKRLEVIHFIANCMSDPSIPRPMSYMDAYFDSIKVNP
jgi:hypothetical protein